MNASMSRCCGLNRRSYVGVGVVVGWLVGGQEGFASRDFMCSAEEDGSCTLGINSVYLALGHWA